MAGREKKTVLTKMHLNKYLDLSLTDRETSPLTQKVLSRINSDDKRRQMRLASTLINNSIMLTQGFIAEVKTWS